MSTRAVEENAFDHDVIVVGAGFAGLYTVIHAARRGLRVHGIEAAPGVGGTWFWNRYPGARCDVESIDYSYSFDPELEREWRWSERYATQPEILRYLEHVADRFEARTHYSFNTRVTGASWDETAQCWHVDTDDGRRATAAWLVMATGPLSTPIVPEITGRDSFAGQILQTSAWPSEPVDFTGKRVAVIGTGASGIQVIPLIAEDAAEVVVYQRTANYSVPAFNFDLDDAEWATQQTGLARRRELSWKSPAGSPWSSHLEPFADLDDEAREAVFNEAWQRGGVLFAKAFRGQTIEREINDAARDFFERKLAERIANDTTRSALTPVGHALGTKRICTDSGYYETYNLPHVHLVSLRTEPITEMTPAGITTTAGAREFDIIVYATGFDAMTGALTSIEIRGRDGRLLRDEWADGPITLLGVGLPGFPNLCVLNGPGTPSVFANMALTSEQQGRFALELIDYCTNAGYSSAEARADAAEAWTQHTQDVAHATLFGSSDSWYTGANLPGKARAFLPYAGGFDQFCARAEAVIDNGFTGFVLSER
ncbi:flavin-containing monooxygenase [Glaciibacter psychrotolerans]|uniref:Cation diffusion facilitator CzcD-associated flavoprotein CzcO n=1 Tax=Glaciibacter psychrotolerans TaxID=670054 RepID=A0A7Z0J6R6_9MICO|nr:NAD(P)/FAD-dependent oxidoreductase [Leifsonia psychrotolerans]NYJ20481.1 cation diffusion facilitator CzcD-associated flavoprotein CzcO [Leifsonia psychrotolerans]